MHVTEVSQSSARGNVEASVMAWLMFVILLSRNEEMLYCLAIAYKKQFVFTVWLCPLYYSYFKVVCLCRNSVFAFVYTRSSVVHVGIDPFICC